MELIFEFIFEILLEGSFELMMSKRIPLFIRILVSIPLILIYGGLFLLITYFIFDSLRVHKFIIAFLLFVVDFIYICLIYRLIMKKIKGDNDGIKG